MDLQAIWFEADLYSVDKATEWVLDHGYSIEIIRQREEGGAVTHHIFAQFEPNEAQPGSFRSSYDGWPQGISATFAERDFHMDEEATKAYSNLTIKKIDNGDDYFTVTGIASTPTPDRDGDIVEPKGASYALPFPLLASHDHDLPVGEVIEANATPVGIEVVARLPKNSGLEYVDRAIKQVKAGLIKAFSIGFRPLVSEPLKSGARLFKQIEIFELSLVAVPANAEANIATIKKYSSEPLDCEEQLFNYESERSDRMERAAAALKKADAFLTK
ncbi:MAG: HK97 family phage prohead protease [Pseudomonadales bacterium]|nr:HK97 family phage prohead protease [Pseudomonadales bacterium]